MPEFNQSRKNVILLIFVAMFAIIIARLFTLQLISAKYKVLADDQGKFRKIIYPDRGIVFDRNGKAILENTVIYDLMVIPAKLKDIDTLALCSILGIDTVQFNKRIAEAIIKNTKIRPSVFEPSLDDAKTAGLNEALYKFIPAFYLQQRSVRSYPYDAAGNVLGYLSEVDSNFLKKHYNEGYLIGDYAGRTGLERVYEKVLMGERGIEYWKRDNKNRLTERLENGKYDTTAIAGKSMHLSLDIGLQQLGEKLMQNKIGAIVALDPRTGGVITMVSSPTYKPSYLTGSERKKHYADLLLNPELPLMNRAIGGTYSPGSTFKTLQALLALKDGVINTHTTVTCSGAYYGCGRRIGCHAPGTFDLPGAIAHSCNTYFEEVFRKLIDQPRFPTIDSSVNVWSQHIHQFGLGQTLGIDMPSEKRGLIPDGNYYDKYRGKHQWNSCGIISVSIGQGEVSATMLQLANAIAIIANKGYYYTPHMVDSIEGGDKYKLLDAFKVKHHTVDISDSIYEIVHNGMQQVMESGTGSAAKVPGITVCGKTGTVENYYMGEKQKDHAFFAAFAPRQNPKIVIAVMCENAGFGAAAAAPIASLMLEKYLKDSITEPDRLAKIDVISKLNYLPPHILRALKTRDSLTRIQDSAFQASRLEIKSVNDTLGLDEDEDDETIDNGNGKPTTQVHGSTKTTTAPAKNKPAAPAVNRIQAIIPDDRSKTDKNDSTNKKH